MSDLKKVLREVSKITPGQLQWVVSEGDPEITAAVEHMRDLVASISSGKNSQENFDVLFEKILQDFDEKYYDILRKYAEIIKNRTLVKPKGALIKWEEKNKISPDETAIDFAWRVYGKYFNEYVLFAGDICKLDYDLYNQIYNDARRQQKSIKDILPNRSDSVISSFIMRTTKPQELWSKSEYTGHSRQKQSAIKHLDLFLKNPSK